MSYGNSSKGRFPRIWPFSQGFGPVVCRWRAGLGVPYVSRWKSSQVAIRPSAAQAAFIPSAAACHPRNSIGPSYKEPPRSETGGASLRPAVDVTDAGNAQDLRTSKV